MKILNQKKNRVFIFALATSIGLPVSVPGIVFGAVFQIWALMAVSILVFLVGFYGCPLLWVSYAKKKYMYSLAIKIEEDGVYSIDSLASIFGKNIAVMLNDVRELISKRFISNYLIDENTRMIVTHEREKKLITFFCPSCGASITRNSTNKYICEYCHSSFEYK